jgi:hypothetical protein
MKRLTLLRLGEFAFLGALYCSVAFFCHERREANEHTLPSVTVPQPTTDTIVLPPVPVTPAVQPEPVKPETTEVEEGRATPVAQGQEIAARSKDDLPPPRPKAQVKAQAARKAVPSKPAPAPAQVQCQPQPQCQPVECNYRRWRRGR